MKKHISNKLGNKRGETIAETLIALLISSLALIMFAGAISAAKNIIDTSRRRYKEYYAADAAMVDGTAEGGGKVTASINMSSVDLPETADSLSDLSYDVDYAVNNSLTKYPTITYDKSTS